MKSMKVSLQNEKESCIFSVFCLFGIKQICVTTVVNEWNSVDLAVKDNAAKPNFVSSARNGLDKNIYS